MLDVANKQATDRGLLLQRAADGTHRRAYRIERVRIVVSVAFGLAAIVATTVPRAAPVIAIAGAAWALASLLIVGASQKETNIAAVIQQQFDTWLFNLSWESYAGEGVADEELHRRARQATISEERLRTWYPDVSGFPEVYAVLACQRENLSWDWRIRRRWADVLVAVTGAWVALGLLIGLAGDLPVRTLCLRWYVPSASMLVLGLQLTKAHREVAGKKEQLATLVRSELETARPGDPDPADEPVLRERCREVQRRIFELRRETARVPRSIYERFRDDDEADMRATVDGLRRQLGL